MKPRYELAKILLDVSRAVSSSLELDRVAELVLGESMRALKTDHASLFLADSATGHLMLTKARGFSGNEIDNIKLLGSWEFINTQVVRRQRPLIVNDVHRDPIFKKKMLPFSREALPIASFLAVPLRKQTTIVGVLIVSNRKRPGHLFTAQDQKLLVGLSNYLAAALLNARLYHDLKKLFLDTVQSLVKAIEAKDLYTSGHSERVMKYACTIARVMSVTDEEMERIRLASVLHDIGKIGIKEAVLGKPGKLSRTEVREIRRHPAIGARIIEAIDRAHTISRGIAEHHERFDGTGYPRGLHGRGISLEGRIIAVADSFDALTTSRPYQKKYSAKEAFFEIKKGSGSQFDPKVVKAFMVSFSRYPELWKT